MLTTCRRRQLQLMKQTRTCHYNEYYKENHVQQDINYNICNISHVCPNFYCIRVLRMINF